MRRNIVIVLPGCGFEPGRERAPFWARAGEIPGLHPASEVRGREEPCAGPSRTRIARDPVAFRPSASSRELGQVSWEFGFRQARLQPISDRGSLSEGTNSQRS